MKKLILIIIFVGLIGCQHQPGQRSAFQDFLNAGSPSYQQRLRQHNESTRQQQAFEHEERMIRLQNELNSQRN